jgi:hypothetical protein
MRLARVPGASKRESNRSPIIETNMKLSRNGRVQPLDRRPRNFSPPSYCTTFSNRVNRDTFKFILPQQPKKKQIPLL